MVFTEGRLTLLSRRDQPQLTSPPANCQSQDLILPSPLFARPLRPSDQPSADTMKIR